MKSITQSQFQNFTETVKSIIWSPAYQNKNITVSITGLQYFQFATNYKQADKIADAKYILSLSSSTPRYMSDFPGRWPMNFTWPLLMCPPLRENFTMSSILMSFGDRGAKGRLEQACNEGSFLTKLSEAAVHYITQTTYSMAESYVSCTNNIRNKLSNLNYELNLYNKQGSTNN